MTDKEKLKDIRKLADAMYYAAQYLTTDASRLHKAMDEYHKFIIHEWREEPVSEVWHDSNKEQPEYGSDVVVLQGYEGDVLHRVVKVNPDRIWAYTNDLLNLTLPDSSERKKEPVSETLEKAATKYAQDKYMPVQTSQAFKSGAEWQKQQDQSTIELAEDHAMFAGMEKMKEEMMAKAIDGVVHHFEKYKVACVYYNDPTGVPMAYFTSPEGLSVGDKVKVIVIKKK